MTLCLLVSLLLGQGAIPRVEGGTVSGIVRFADGKPVGGVRVAAMAVPDAEVEIRGASELVSISQTDASGRYRLEDVPPGRYFIVAGRIDVPTFYPAATDIAAARPVVITAGTAVDQIDVTVSAESARPAPRRFDRINFPLGPPQLVRGRIVMDDSSKGAKLPASVVLSVRRSGVPTIPSARITVAADGTFSHSYLVSTGEAEIVISGLPDGYSIKSVTAGTTDLLSQPLQISAGMPEIVVVLTADPQPQRFRIGGQVAGGARGELLGEQIELVSESGTASRVILDTEGRFLFQRVLPGKYILRLSSPKLRLPDRPITVTDQDITTELGK